MLTASGFITSGPELMGMSISMPILLLPEPSRPKKSEKLGWYCCESEIAVESWSSLTLMLSMLITSSSKQCVGLAVGLRVGLPVGEVVGSPVVGDALG